MASPLGFDISILGDKDLDRKFAQATAKLQKKVLRPAMRKGARPILQDAKVGAPVRLGRMKKTLKIRAMKRSRNRIGVMIQTGTRAQLGIDANDPYYYPMAVETGTRRMAARPFMRPALKKNKAKTMGILSREIRRGLQSIVK